MEDQTVQSSGNSSSLQAGKNLLKVLSSYPLFWCVAILLGGYLQNHFFIMFIMITWMLFTYVGSLLWLILVIYYLEGKKMTWKEAGIHFIVAVTGIIAAYYIWMYDVFNNGVKYID